MTPWRKQYERLLERVDPNDDPEAEPISAVALLVLLAAITTSVAGFVAYPVQPMQDLGHHLALAAVNVDRGRPGSLFTELYLPMDVLSANSFLYTLAIPLAKVMRVTTAVRAMIGFYLVGVPLTTAWALRVYGRSIWPAVLSAAFVYNMVYVAGFVNLLFAAPFMILALPFVDRCLERRTTGYVVAATLLFVIVFLSHAHAFLWTGFLCAMLVVGRVLAAALAQRPVRERLRDVAIMVVLALTTVAPSLVLFLRWYRRTFGEARHAGGVMAATATAGQWFGAYWKPPHDVLSELVTYNVKWFQSDDSDLRLMMMAIALFVFAVALSRLERRRKPPILELACALTLASYFLLPEGLTGHDVVASRQVSLAMWFAPAFFAPVSAKASRPARYAVILGTVVLTLQLLSTWRKHLAMFADETRGLLSVIRRAPPRKWMHYVKIDTYSAVYTWQQFMHLDKYYSSERFGQIADTPAILSTAAMRYRSGIDIHRIAEHSHAWAYNDDVWKSFDLILVRKWQPSADALTHARSKGILLAAEGDWQLWQSNVVQRDSSATSAMPPPVK